jgi:predicted secreted protein
VTISSAIAIYFVLWWLVLFLVLPFGVRSQSESGDDLHGTDPGAPVLAGMGRKALWTTVVSTIVFAIGAAAYSAGYLNVERLTRLMGFPF